MSILKALLIYFPFSVKFYTCFDLVQLTRPTQSEFFSELFKTFHPFLSLQIKQQTFITSCQNYSPYSYIKTKKLPFSVYPPPFVFLLSDSTTQLRGKNSVQVIITCYIPLSLFLSLAQKRKRIVRLRRTDKKTCPFLLGEQKRSRWKAICMQLTVSCSHIAASFIMEATVFILCLLLQSTILRK